MGAGLHFPRAVTTVASMNPAMQSSLASLERIYEILDTGDTLTLGSASAFTGVGANYDGSGGLTVYAQNVPTVVFDSPSYGSLQFSGGVTYTLGGDLVANSLVAIDNALTILDPDTFVLELAGGALGQSPLSTSGGGALSTIAWSVTIPFSSS